MKWNFQRKGPRSKRIIFDRPHIGRRAGYNTEIKLKETDQTFHVLNNYFFPSEEAMMKRFASSPPWNGCLWQTVIDSFSPLKRYCLKSPQADVLRGIIWRNFITIEISCRIQIEPNCIGCLQEIIISYCVTNSRVMWRIFKHPLQHKLKVRYRTDFALLSSYFFLSYNFLPYISLIRYHTH